MITFLFPFPMSLMLMAAGISLLWISPKKILGKILVILAGLILLFSSIHVFSSPVVRFFENAYPSLPEDVSFSTKTTGVRYVVVLGHGYYDNPRVSLVSRQTSEQLVRLIEGIVLHRRIPGSKLVLSGGSRKKVSEAETMSQLAVALGVSEADLMIEPLSHNTYQEAILLKETLRDTPFLLVTSAMHMRRAMALFQRQGMHPIPAPTGHLARTGSSYPHQFFFPSSQQVTTFHIALYEVLGWVKEYLLGRI